MKKLSLCVFIVVAVLARFSAHAQCPSIIEQTVCDAADANRFAAVLTPEQEPAGGLAGASGFAVFVIDREQDMIFYRVDVGTLTDIIGAHIHPGAAGVVGPIVIDLMQGGLTFEDGVLEGSATADGALLDQIFANPSGFYVNVHTTAFPAGAIRGQLNGRGAASLAGELTLNGAGSAMGVFGLNFVDDQPSANDVRLDFDIMTDNVDDLDGVTLREGSGDDAEDVADLEDDDGFNDGRLRGSVRISREEMTRILANPAGFNLQLRSPSSGTLEGAIGEAETMFIPVFGRTQNGFGNLFNSDLRLFNPNNQAVNVFIQFFPAGSTNALAGRTAVVRLEPGEARVISDAVQSLFGRSSDIGSLRIVSSAPIVADSEILDDVARSNVRASSHNPRFGQFISGIARCHAVTQGLLTSLSASEGFRTNILVTNPGNRTALARFELRNDQGQLVDTRTINIGANAQLLIPLTGTNGLFRNAGAVNNAIVRVNADTPLFLGGSVIQNSTGEARFIEGRDIGRPFNSVSQ